MPGAHATFSPSAAKRSCHCPPSVLLNKKYNDIFGEKSSEYAEEGTKAHELSEIKLRRANGEINDFEFHARRDKLEEKLGKIPVDMDRYTEDYVDVVLTELYAMRKACAGTRLFVEQKLDMQELIPGCWGTSDSVIVSDAGLIVIDLKYGQGVPVEAEGNYQARIYAIGAYLTFHELYDFNQIKEIIVQPRLDSVTQETIDVIDLLQWAQEEVIPQAKQAMVGEGDFKAGDWCRFCNVKPICREHVLSSLSVVQNMLDSPDVVSDKTLEAILPFLDTAEDWISDVRKYALAQALAGKQWCGYKVVRGKRPNKTWVNEEEVVDQLSRAGYKPEQYSTTPKLLTPSAMRTALGGAAFDALLEKQVFQGEGKLSLVPESDKREAYTTADLDFADLDSK